MTHPAYRLQHDLDASLNHSSRRRIGFIIGPIIEALFVAVREIHADLFRKIFLVEGGEEQATFLSGKTYILVTNIKN
ncbi:MAG: hypothetical protein GTN73_09000 [Candidatus Aminicenantes bacterium]|nr:hypothetical protein [Candidatus Aminicenantes bacterium]